jgi:hypothetical protein
MGSKLVLPYPMQRMCRAHVASGQANKNVDQRALHALTRVSLKPGCSDAAVKDQPCQNPYTANKPTAPCLLQGLHVDVAACLIAAGASCKHSSTNYLNAAVLRATNVQVS